MQTQMKMKIQMQMQIQVPIQVQMQMQMQVPMQVSMQTSKAAIHSMSKNQQKVLESQCRLRFSFHELVIVELALRVDACDSDLSTVLTQTPCGPRHLTTNGGRQLPSSPLLCSFRASSVGGPVLQKPKQHGQPKHS